MQMSTKAEYTVAIASTLIGRGYMNQKESTPVDGDAVAGITNIVTEIINPTQCQSIVEQMRTLKVELKEKQEKHAAEKQRSAQETVTAEGRPSQIHKKAKT
ncbi:hypothetical protein HDU93_005027 [Gonapodya sp. JEL0774]|nr:hypothetical protein HDU93_005027 [Gonapodya sp. JEL0774]